MKASSILSTLVVLVVIISVASGTRYTVSFQGLVGRLCGSSAPSGCPDPSPCYISGSPIPTGTPIYPSPSTSGQPGVSPSPGSSGIPLSASASTSVSASTGQTPTASPSFGSSGSGSSSSPSSGTSASGSQQSSSASASTGQTPTASSSFGSSGSGTSSSPSSASSGSGTSASGSVSSSASFSASTGQTPTASSSLSSSAGTSSSPGSSASSSAGASGTVGSSSSCPVAPSCSVAPSCTPCFCATPSSFPSFSRPASSSPSVSPSAAASTTNTATRSVSASFTATPSPQSCQNSYNATATNSFNVGLLFDRSTWARDNNNPAYYGALYAINQINAAGGINIGGRNISLNPVVYDTQGTPNGTVIGADSLTRISCVAVMIGTETGAERRAVQSQILSSTASSNASPGLLLNPQNYEATDVNAGVINFGSNLLTNTRRAIDWAVANGKYHVHLLGSDDVDSRVINAYARQYIGSTYPQVLIIGENYIPVGASEFTAQQTYLAPLYIGQDLFNNAAGNNCTNGTACTLLLSSVFGQAANRVLYSALAARYLTPTNPNLPYVVMALRNDQYQFNNFSRTNVNNQLMGTNYLDGVDAVQNANIASWKAGLVRFLNSVANVNAYSILNDSYINITTGGELRAYNAIRLWANAVAAAGTADPRLIRDSITTATFNAPNGLISVNATSREATTPTTPFYVSRLNVPALGPLTVTPLTSYTDPFQQFAPPAGNLNSTAAYNTLVSGINAYYNSVSTQQQLTISYGWEIPANPSPIS